MGAIEWTDERLAKLQLSCIEGLGSSICLRLLERFGSASAILGCSEETLLTTEGLSMRLVRRLLSPKAKLKAEEERKALDARGGTIRPIFIGEEDYPLPLAECQDAPIVLYSRGALPYDAPMISIVGTRRMTLYSTDVLDELLRAFARYMPNLVVVSGLAYGVDITAHTLAMKHGLRTVAVVAHGLDMIYPSAHYHAAQEICERGGAILSEYTHDVKPYPARFVARNRIVACLSAGTIVIESRERGGALITANIAFDYNRQLFAVPGRLFDTSSQGCNKLIALNKAQIVTTPLDILLECGLMKKRDLEPTALPFDDDEKAETPLYDDEILKLLSGVNDLSLEEIAARLDESVSNISSRLFDLEMDEQVHLLPGGRYALAQHL